MTMELEGDLQLERAHTRRWVAIIAVLIPVSAVVLLSAWFIRVYVAPPTVAIPSPMIVAEEAPPAAPAPPQVEAPPPQQTTAMAEPAPPPSPPAGERRVATALPMFATLSVVPPSLESTPSRAYADPAQDTPVVVSSITVTEPAPAEPAAVAAAAEPLAGPVPLPHAKPHRPLALAASAVPLPRPRPVEAEPPHDDLPAFDRHAVD
jgi:hypothetical protein